jgi:hypothetical protein
MILISCVAKQGSDFALPMEFIIKEKENES